MVTLCTRKTVYKTVTIIAGLIWLPLMVVGLIVGIGVLGLFCIVNLLRCISEMLIEGGFERGLYTVTMLLGIVLMSTCMGVIVAATDGLTGVEWVLLISGATLVVLALLVFAELYGGFAKRGR